ncbi:hypothetical protein BASA81_000494 [Batrachochytrium salamandrivorans]|nr:hypothetical protein BASA81_000494 [Batrachochytrium salamandrivorans]
MNLVLGPNGSGKSSLVCAICLGLGGDPKHLERAGSLQSFVKWNETKALIEIELYATPPRKNLVVQRWFVSKNNTTEWSLDGKPATRDLVLEQLRKFDIQVDNLCQFLPQDKVQEFSKYTDKELLKETIRVVLGRDMLEQQKILADLQKKSSGAEASLASQTKALNELEGENKRNEGTVKRQLERVTLEEKIALMEKKLPWTKFKHEQDRAKQAKMEYKAGEQEMQKGSVTLQPLKDKLRELEVQSDKAKKQFDTAVKEKEGEQDNLEKTHDVVVDLIDKLGKHRESIEAVDSRKKRALEKCVKQRDLIAKLEAKMQDKRGAEYYKAQIAEIRHSMRPLEEKSSEALNKVTSLSAELTRKSQDLQRRVVNKLRELDLIINNDSSIAVQRQREQQEKVNAELIRTKLAPFVTPKQLEALLRYRQQPDLLNAKMIGPLICELRATNDSASAALEFYVPKNQWKFVVSTEESDMARLNRDGVSNILVASSDNVSKRPSTYNAELFRDVGILGYLDEFIHAEPLALEAGRRLVKLHHCLVGSAKTDEVYNSQPDLFRKLTPSADFTDKITIFTPTSRFDITRSKYEDKDPITKRVGVEGNRKPFNLPLHRAVADNSVRVQQAKDQAKAEHQQLMQEKDEGETALARIKQDKDEAAEESNALTAQVKQMRLDMNKLTKAKVDEDNLESNLEAERTKLGDLEREANRDWAAMVEEHHKAQSNVRDKIETHLGMLSFPKVGKRMARLVEHSLAKAQLESERLLIANLHREEEQRVNQMAGKLDALKKKYEALLLSTKRAKEHAERICPDYSAYQDQFDELPDTLEALQELIDATKYNVDRIFTDAGVVKRFEENANKIAQLKREIDKQQMEMSSETIQLQMDVKNWIDPVANAVESINQKFAELFERVSAGGYFCRANVKLRHEPANGLLDCGAEVMVTFRQDQEMQRLTPKVQSGGERSLTTFMYMLSLQSKSKVPFRVVDEINQGIDQSKERLAFNIMASTTSEHPAQYFIATPKLLPGLTFPKDCTVLFVFNGPLALTQKQWNRTPFSQKRTFSIAQQSPRKEEAEEEEEHRPVSRRTKRSKEEET